MSCWVEYSCDVLKNVNKKRMKEALQSLGYDLDDTNHRVNGFGGKNAIVDAVLTKNGKEQMVGLIFDDGTGHVKIEGDFWELGIDDEQFVDQLAVAYQRINMTARLKLMGYSVDKRTVNVSADGSVEFDAYCYA